ncbi:MAG: DUF2961 domain-containing protein [Planctomycetes bacterium]|nr:DUF2961 domain-containing protein [Planctomycetota bacterium]
MDRSSLRWCCCALSVLTATLGRAQDLEEITHPLDARRMRTSSGLFDPESNDDALRIGPGATVTLADLEGPGEIRHIWFTIGAEHRRYPRSLVLRVYWDDAEVPSVEAPLGDFFAAGNGMRATVSSLPIEVTSYGRAMNSYWRMPFAKRARLTMTNESDSRVTSCYYYVDWMQHDRAPDPVMYFHARYRQEFPVPEFTPYTVADIRGRGHYVGTVLSIQSCNGEWLGESDDRFYIDGEATPSLVGTGMEDYLSDAWNLRLFSNLRAGVTIYEPKALDQRMTAYRWHVAAPITFRESLRFEIERRSFMTFRDPDTGRNATVDFVYRPDFLSSVAFWYATAPAPRFWDFPPADERLEPELMVETSQMIDRIRHGDDVRVELRSNRAMGATGGASRKKMTFVGNDGPGGWFEVPFAVPRAGVYSISVFQSLFWHYGVWKVSLRGPGFDAVLDPALDFWIDPRSDRANEPESTVYGTWCDHKCGVHTLPAGDYVMRFECVGANPQSRRRGTTEPGYDLGLDGISLRYLRWQGDLREWLREHLGRAEEREAANVAEARRVVALVAAAIDEYRRRNGELPATLAQLAAAVPPVLPAGLGPRLPLDPWGQEYRYAAPGTVHPDGFDVWSVHGNSRRPGGYLGNW